MCSGATKAGFFSPVRTVGILAVLKIKPDLVEALLGDKILTFRTKISAVDDSVDELRRIGA